MTSASPPGSGGADSRQRVLRHPAEVTERLKELARPGDLILTVGAGDIYTVGEALVPEPAESRQKQGAGRPSPRPFDEREGE